MNEIKWKSLMLSLNWTSPAMDWKEFKNTQTETQTDDTCLEETPSSSQTKTISPVKKIDQFLKKNFPAFLDSCKYDITHSFE